MRGQAHTLEAVAAAVLLVGGLVFATSATAVTPLSASTSNQHIENQQGATVEGLLEAAAEDGSLREAVLYWDPDEEGFHNATDGGTYATAPADELAFGESLAATLSSRRIAFNVVLRYGTASGDTAVQPMVRMGEPSHNAVSARRTIGLYDGANLTSPGHRNATLGTAGFYADDADADSRLYTVVEVEVIAWRK